MASDALIRDCASSSFACTSVTASVTRDTSCRNAASRSACCDSISRKRRFVSATCSSASHCIFFIFSLQASTACSCSFSAFASSFSAFARSVFILARSAVSSAALSTSPVWWSRRRCSYSAFATSTSRSLRSSEETLLRSATISSSASCCFAAVFCLSLMMSASWPATRSWTCLRCSARKADSEDALDCFSASNCCSSTCNWSCSFCTACSESVRDVS